ncbi:ATP-dependent RNA helicase DBP3 [Cryptococcus floricola]|uniref:RNA helicase n=1 Tax=Cryptococcus floricola TaxID=2591691 RepID=A0A5D3B2R2_9TREE|nr:ATP-dependent RNA helicase DBP3 [Cryptococcus floricola]
MSSEDAPKLTKEEKKARKEAKQAKKAAKVAASAEATPAESTEATPATEEVKPKKEKKDKKDKKRKDVDAEEAPKEEASEEPPKKKKKSKSTDDATPAPAATEEPISKKQQKKLAKAAAAEEATKTAAASLPAVEVSTTFTPEHTAFLTENAITLLPHTYPPVLSIPSLPVNPKITKFLSKFTKPTPIQACSWPPLLTKRDVVGIAETGSGKTLAFGVPGVNLLSGLAPVTGSKKGRGQVPGQIQILVLAPTRELAQQSHDNLAALAAEVGIKSTCIFGGVGKDGQARELSDTKTRIVVGTPGRTLDLADSGDLDLSSVSYLVLDEADRMLDAGFENDIRRIIAHTPGHEQGRQTVMFSATWPESVRRLAATFLNKPVRITVGSDELSANKRIEQVVEVLDDPRGKDPRLIYHIRAHLKANPNSTASPTRILVFALYKKEAQRLEQTIRRGGFQVGALHGDMTQDARFKALDNFKTGKQNILVATDVAARGLDIPDVNLVINVTFPLTTEDFVHRCGRTGRAGKSGKAVTFFTGENHEKSLAGEFMRVLRDAGAEIPKEMDRFPTTIKKKEHGSYGAFYKDTTNAPPPTKITFD